MNIQNIGILKPLFALPSNQYMRNRYFYVQYDLFWIALLSTLLVIWSFTGAPHLMPEFNAKYFWFLPIACYIQILSTALVHNASHNNFPKALNRIAGEFFGVIVLTRFASWEIVHRRHHRYSDNPEKDPHPVVKNYWKFCLNTITSVEKQLQNCGFDLFGKTPENIRFEKRRALLSFGTGMLLIFTWYQLMGKGGFWQLVIPATVVGFFQLMHFNWATHNAQSPTGDFKPIDQDTGLLWIGNRIFFGFYNHAIHHTNPRIFNPANKKEVARKMAALNSPVETERKGWATEISAGSSPQLTQ